MRPPGTAGAQLMTPAQYDNQFMSTGAAHYLLDVRTAEEYASGHIADSVNIALQELQTRLSEIPRDVPVVIYCRSGNRSAQAARLLVEAGYSQIYDLGGIIAWTAQGYPLE
ncbi:MAG: rhodanese-like domain-containing protein [Chloroflexi bacterium]|nr:rhodanese-like domain-containing protein [Chloroflexota bacterium]